MAESILEEPPRWPPQRAAWHYVIEDPQSVAGMKQHRFTDAQIAAMRAEVKNAKKR
jgi:hypothetical protein